MKEARERRRALRDINEKTYYFKNPTTYQYPDPEDDPSHYSEDSQPQSTKIPNFTAQTNPLEQPNKLPAPNADAMMPPLVQPDMPPPVAQTSFQPMNQSQQQQHAQPNLVVQLP